jgi:predicted GIY-YIG superfamily endonuclease
MFYAYLLRSPEHGIICVGYTEDLKRRFAEHRQPPRHKGWKLIYYEAYREEGDARERERMLKHYGSSLGRLKERLKGSLDLSRI